MKRGVADSRPRRLASSLDVIAALLNPRTMEAMTNSPINSECQQLVSLDDCEGFIQDLMGSPHHGVILDRTGMLWRIRRDVYSDLYIERLAYGYGAYEESRIDRDGLFSLCPVLVVYLAY